MKIVKLTYNYDVPVLIQTPTNLGIWEDYKFIIDDNLKECDFWVISTDYKLENQEVICNKENIIFVIGEGYHTSPKYDKHFLNQFGKVITVQKELQGKNIVHWQNGINWFVKKSYDGLKDLEMPAKSKLLSIVSSTKSYTEGHRKRLDFVMKLKDYYGDKIDLFGRGLNDFDDKWDVLAAYKYHIAIENDYCDDYFTEKLMDPLLAFTYPIYYGCPNLNKYFPDDAYSRIDINDLEGSIKVIDSLLNDDKVYNNFILNINNFRDLVLNKFQFFPMLVDFMKEMDASLPKRKNTVFAHSKFQDTFLKNTYRNLRKSFGLK